MTSSWFKNNFPWLGTDDDVSGADVIDRLNELYTWALTHEADPEMQAYRKQAKDEHHVDGEVEIDENAVVSVSSDGGAYVLAWVWVYDDEDNT